MAGNVAVRQLLRSVDAPLQRFAFGELWQGVASAASSAWSALSSRSQGAAASGGGRAGGSAGGGSVGGGPGALQVPTGSFTVTDAQAIIRRPPPQLTAMQGKPTIPPGTTIELLEAARKGNKFYINARAQGAGEAAGGWTAASNVDGLPAQLATLNPPTEAPTSDDDVVPAPPGGAATVGTTAAPALQHPAYLAIVSEIEQLEQNPVGIDKSSREETGGARTELVEKLGALRAGVAGLGAAIPGLDAGQLRAAQAYLYRRLNPLAPYYGQMANTNLLGTEGTGGWMRTCNVTVPAMVLEGLGKTKADFDSGRVPLLERIFAALEGKYKEFKGGKAMADFDTLRLPDFLALVGIERQLPADAAATDGEAFTKAVAKARKKAAAATTAHATMMYLLDQLGASHERHSVHTSALDKIGEARRGVTRMRLAGQNPEKYRAIYDQIQALGTPEERTAAFKQLKSAEQKAYKALWSADQLSAADADALLSVDTYRSSVLRKMNPLLDAGAQILVGMENHFVRLDALDQEAVQVDDPGQGSFKNVRMTWAQARDQGMFKVFWSVSA